MSFPNGEAIRCAVELVGEAHTTVHELEPRLGEDERCESCRIRFVKLVGFRVERPGPYACVFLCAACLSVVYRTRGLEDGLAAARDSAFVRIMVWLALAGGFAFGLATAALVFPWRSHS